MPFVLDACGMIAFVREAPGAEIVVRLLTNGQCVAHALNMCELYYDFFRAANRQTASDAVSDLLSLGLAIREDMDREFWQEVGRLKAEIKRISLADCCTIALTERINGTLATSDHHEFDPIFKMKICEILS